MTSPSETTKESHESTPTINRDKGTIMLVSGNLDHAILAFEVAVGMQAMGTQMNMWFILQGVNCLKKPRSHFSLSRFFSFNKLSGTIGRNKKTDTGWQKILQILNHQGAEHLPMSQLNFLGAGPFVLSRIMKKKGMASLTELIKSAEQLGVNFKICQICVDAMACDMETDLIVKAEVAGVSRYMIDTRDSHYNAVI
ncbi:MAG: DsrE/DsrF/DrsH-like family protein [Gammaproteobacteria bacterium]|nr:DsrE/DsrF/DrsH-like family protein [Gammaproteobacteria bacterium]